MEGDTSLNPDKKREQRNRIVISIEYFIIGAFLFIVGLIFWMENYAKASVLGQIIVIALLLLGFYFAMVSPISILTGHKTPKGIKNKK